jgi:hypothetical protein
MAKEEEMSMLKEGTVIEGPDGMAYRVTRTILTGEAMDATVFDALNGAPKPIAGEPMAPWLFNELLRLSEQPKD